MRNRYSSSRIGFVCVSLLTALAISPAWAGWGPDGVTIRATTATIPLISACSDGGTGSFVAWQEGSSGHGVLRLQHVLATGDVDPAWPPDGMVACAGDVVRVRLGAMPDHAGGIYLWWCEGSALFLQHVDGTGAVVPGWADCGAMLGTAFIDSPALSVVGDGANGLYAAWADGSTAHSRAMLIHIAPNGDELGGGAVSPASALVNVYYARVALAPDGGAYVAWGSSSSNPALTPSDWRIRRVQADVSNAAGWPLSGIAMGPFRRDLLGTTAKSGLLGLCADGRGGAFMVTGNPSPDASSIETRLYRLQGDGQSASDWPSAGVQVRPTGLSWYVDLGDDASYQVLGDGRDGAFVGLPSFYDHATDYAFVRVLSTGAVPCCGGLEALLGGHEYAAIEGGGVWLASFYPTGPYGYYQPDAFLALNHTEPSAWGGFWEDHPEILMHWFDDIGLASTSDGSAVFFWSQVHDRYGLFARSFSPGGEVMAVIPPPITRLELRSLRFVRGAGVRGAVALPGAGPARIGLYDLGGRRIASLDLRGTRGVSEFTLANTAALSPGVYFARAISGAGIARGRVLVLR